MVEPAGAGGRQAEWAPRTAGIAGCGVAGAVMAILSATAITDPPGRVLAGIAGIGLLMFAGMSWRARPRLALTGRGLVVRGWWRNQLLQPADVTLARITEFRRIGRKVQLLEIDTVDDQLLVFSRWDLGTQPLEVLDALTAAGYTGPRSGGPGGPRTAL
jgi:Bacterial PH domain